MRALRDLAQQQTATVRADLATVKSTHHRTPSQAAKSQLTCRTLCVHGLIFSLAITP
jgi:hypothetical protein